MAIHEDPPRLRFFRRQSAYDHMNYDMNFRKSNRIYSFSLFLWPSGAIVALMRRKRQTAVTNSNKMHVGKPNKIHSTCVLLTCLSLQFMRYVFLLIMMGGGGRVKIFISIFQSLIGST